MSGSTISTSDLLERLEVLRRRKTRESTYNNYYGIWKTFNKFLLKLDNKPKKWEDRVVLFCVHYVNKGTESQTIKSYVSAIKSILLLVNYELNCNALLLNSLTRACSLENDHVRTRLHISCKLLELILFEVARKYKEQPYLNMLFQAILLLGYYGLFRVGELVTGEQGNQHTAKAKDVYLGVNKEKILVVLYSSKTHSKHNIPQKIKIKPNEKQIKKQSQSKKFFCPFQAMKNYMAIRGDYTHNKENFFIFRDGKHVNHDQVRVVLRTAIKDLGLNPWVYNTHSLRCGRAVDMLKYGYTIDQIKLAGWWKSNAIYRYLIT